jgi:hypothetical protein
MRFTLRRLVGLSVVVGALATTVYAVDGIVLIDQTRALVGGVTPGDAPGFPVSITRAGSYRLSSNLVVPADGRAIAISAPNVTMDLNGFSIATTFPQPIPNNSRGIVWTGTDRPTGITVRNGTIEGFLSAIQLSANINNITANCRFCSFIDLHLNPRFDPGTSVSFDLGGYTRMFNVTAPDTSINVRCPSVVSNSVARNIGPGVVFPGDPDVNAGQCTFANNATLF